MDLWEANALWSRGAPSLTKGGHLSCLIKKSQRFIHLVQEKLILLSFTWYSNKWMKTIMQIEVDTVPGGGIPLEGTGLISPPGGPCIKRLSRSVNLHHKINNKNRYCDLLLKLFITEQKMFCLHMLLKNNFAILHVNVFKIKEFHILALTFAASLRLRVWIPSILALLHELPTVDKYM